MIIHPFDPVYDRNSKIIILGTFPSVASRKDNFYYGHPKNRFWKVISILTENPLPNDIEEKKSLLLRENIAIWDVLRSCDIDQSKDSSILNPVPNNFKDIFGKIPLKAVFTNGRKAEELYRRLCYPETNFISICLPSTSPANASCSLDRLIREWSAILKFIR